LNTRLFAHKALHQQTVRSCRVGCAMIQHAKRFRRNVSKADKIHKYFVPLFVTSNIFASSNFQRGTTQSIILNHEMNGNG